MRRFLAFRLLQSLGVLALVITLTFFMVRLAPGGPFSAEKAVSAEVREALDAAYGLNKPLLEQYAAYCQGLFRGYLGPTLYQGWSAREILACKLPVSAELGFWSLVVAVCLGLSSGIYSGVHAGKLEDRLSMAMVTAGVCLPTFVIGPLLVLVLAMGTGWFSVLGWNTASDRVLPALTLGIHYAACIARLTRGSLVSVLNELWVRTARAKGLPEWKVVGVHALRNAFLPVVSYLGPTAAGLVSGSFVVETLFDIPGLGRFFVDSALGQDYFMVGACVLFYAAALVVLNLLSDVALSLLDPRIRLESPS